MAYEKTTQYFSGQGKVFLSKKDATTGLYDGFLDVGNCSKLGITFKTDVQEHKESRSGNRLVDLRMTTGKTAEASMTLDSFDADTIAKAMYGSVVTSVSGTVTAEAITAKLDRVHPLAFVKVASVVLKGTGANAAITYVIDKNYTVNTETGSIYILSAAAQTAASAVNSIAADAVLTVAYTYSAQTKVSGFTGAQPEFQLRFEGLNTADGNKPVVVTIPRFTPDPLKSLDLIDDKFQTFEMSGAALMNSATSEFCTIQQV
jgi:hypothetical protein